jgi:hypothetical protein
MKKTFTLLLIVLYAGAHYGQNTRNTTTTDYLMRGLKPSEQKEVHCYIFILILLVFNPLIIENSIINNETSLLCIHH